MFASENIIETGNLTIFEKGKKSLAFIKTDSNGLKMASHFCILTHRAIYIMQTSDLLESEYSISNF